LYRINIFKIIIERPKETTVMDIKIY